MSTNIKNLPAHEKEEAISALFSLAKSMEGKDGAKVFIEHMLTKSEQITIGRRVLIARMLLSGNNRAQIRHTLGVSPNTFTRTRKWLENELPNYSDALKDFEKEQAIKQARRKKHSRPYIDPFSFTALRKKYPAHFLLFNLFLK